MSNRTAFHQPVASLRGIVSILAVFARRVAAAGQFAKVVSALAPMVATAPGASSLGLRTGSRRAASLVLPNKQMPSPSLGWLVRAGCLPVAVTALLGGDAASASVSSVLAVDPLVASMLLLVAAGMFSGLLAGLLGIGGALVTIPVLHLALPSLGVDAAVVPATAVATALMAMVPMTLIAAWRQQCRGAIDTGWLFRMAGPTACGAACGALLAAALNGPVLAFMFALQSCWYGARLLLDRCGVDARGEGRDVWQRFARLPPWLAATPMAAFCACVGMGGGSMVTPFLLRQRVPFRNAVATAGALNLCIALPGTLAFALAGTSASSAGSCLPAALVLAGGAMVSVTFGVSLAHRVPAVVLQRLIGITNVVSAACLLWQVAFH